MDSLVKDSTITDFTKAKEEWILVNVEKHDDWNQCLCGKDIKELCYIKNKVNEKVLIVGNECINKICPSGNYSTKTKKLFASIKKLSKNNKLDKLLIEYCFERKILNDWEYKFSLDTHFKNQLSEKQMNRRKIINEKILRSVKF